MRIDQPQVQSQTCIDNAPAQFCLCMLDLTELPHGLREGRANTVLRNGRRGRVSDTLGRTQFDRCAASERVANNGMVLNTRKEVET